MADDQDKAIVAQLQKKVNEMEKVIDALKQGTLPVNDNFRISNGIGFISTTTDTTPGGAIIVNSPAGIIKILTV